MKIVFTFLVFILCILQSTACGNYYYTLDREGTFHEADDILVPFNKNFKLEMNVQKMKLLSAKLKKEKSYMLLSDYALCLLKLGKVNEAVALLAELELHYPDEYKIASNLGTAYELSGQNDSALKYINRGLFLYSNDHEGSEWIHIKILETKIALSKNPDYLKTHTALSLTDAQLHDSLVRKQFTLQMRERFPFTPAPNELMAAIMSELGDCCANTSSIEYAKAIYQIANEYYGAHSLLLDEKIMEMQKLVNKYLNKHPKKHPSDEGEHSKMGVLKYTSLIQDNQTDKYEINWDKINTDVDSLLAMVDLTLTPLKAKEQSVDDELKLASDNSVQVIIPDTTVTNETGKTFWIITSIIAAMISAFAFMIFKMRKR